MRRLICLLAALVAVAGSLATAGHAMAENRREERREQSGGGRGMGQVMRNQDMGRAYGGRAAPPQAYRPQEYRGQEYGGQEYRQQEYRQPEYRPQEYRTEQRADPRYGYRGEPQPYAQRSDPRYDPRVYAAPPPNAYSAAPRRGGYMGPEGAPVVGDYAAKRLRSPPPGYDWMQTPRGYALVSRQTHQVFDVVPY